MLSMAIKMNNGDGVYTASEIMDLHLEVANNNKGKVSFSTNIPVDSRKITRIERIYFFSTLDNTIRVLSGNIEDIQKYEQPVHIESLAKQGPKEFIKDVRKTWFMIKDFTEMSEEEIKEKIIEAPLNKKWVKMSLAAAIHQTDQLRTNRFYIREK